ncbi:MAG: hypothetical protein CSA94_00050 [Bacteroidetes bacterium]|nr:MAG: hypothetical protein CSA94_00050 [Bacteroidota bacterium]
MSDNIHSIFNKIIEDQEITPFFLSYIKQNLLVRKLPKEISFEASEETKTHFLKTTWDFKKSAETIINKLHQYYQVPNDLSESDSQMNMLLDQVCQYWLKEKGEAYITRFQDEMLLKEEGKS